MSGSQPNPQSCWRPMTAGRALVLDTLHFARRVPLFPVEQTFDLARVAALRKQSPRRISWAVLFLKAYALAAREQAVLRRAYVRWPWPHFVETSASVAMLTINRQHRGEDRLCWGRFISPESQSLASLQRRLDRYEREPVEKAFDKQLRLSWMPATVRRLLLGWNLNVAGRHRAIRVGTFSMSSLAGQGTLNRGHPSFLTSSLTYGPLDERGRTIVTLLCDHRVLDGVAAARALTDLQQIFHGQIAEELAAIKLKKAA
ncbi:MAG: hypothetical protein WD872_20285 [Pirellulaceae bacterium]